MSVEISCSSCKACCCQLEVMLIAGDDAVPAEFIEKDAWGGEIMHRLADGWSDRDLYRAYPNLTPDALYAVFAFASEMLRDEEYVARRKTVA